MKTLNRVKKFKSNLTKKIFLATAVIFLLLPLTASAYSLKKGDAVYVPKDEIIEGNLYAVGSSLIIDGKVTGDVICAGQSININGNIGGNLRVVGNTINFNGQVARNAMVIGTTAVTSASSTIGWDLLILGNIFEKELAVF